MSGEAEPRGIVCGAHNFFAGDKVVVTLPGCGAARAVPDRGAQDLRPRLRRHDRLGAGTRPRRRARRHPAARRARPRPRGRHRCDRAARPGRRRRRDQRHPRPRLRAVDPRRRPRVLALHRCAVPRPGRRGRRSSSAAPASGFRVLDRRRRPDPRADRRARVRHPHRARRRPDPADAAVDGRAARAGRHPLDLAPRRHHQLRRCSSSASRSTATTSTSSPAGSRCAGRSRGRSSRPSTARCAASDAEDLLITDESGPIGLAGVMGGASTEMGAATTNVLIEAANFDPISIARTARRHKLPSEASRRFERGVDPKVAAHRRRARRRTAGRARRRHRRLARCRSRRVGAPPTPIELPRGFVGVHHRRGLHAERDRRRARPRSARRYADAGRACRSRRRAGGPTSPTRPTLAEEVARIVGYDRIPSVLPVAPPGRGLTRAQQRPSPRRADARRRRADRGARLPVRVRRRRPFERVRPGGAGDQAREPARPAAGAFLRRSLLPGLRRRPRAATCRAASPISRCSRSGTVFLPESGVAYGTGFIAGRRPATGCRDAR